MNRLGNHWLTPSKWILAGEHTVLRGGEALVFPLFAKSMRWEIQQTSGESLKINFTGETASEIEMIFGFVLEKACEIAGIERKTLKGNLHIDSQILLGMGLGASASLAVGIARLFNYTLNLNLHEIEFAQKIENYFHGESSGVDVAVVYHQKPLIFKRDCSAQLIEKYNLPLLTLSHCGRRGPTKDCVEKVKDLFVTDLTRAEAIDRRMNESVEAFKKLIVDGERKEWIAILEKAHSCFEDWDLVPVEAQNHIAHLKSQGAKACKMTGSGGGGYILSLWDRRSDFEGISSIIPLDQKLG